MVCNEWMDFENFMRDMLPGYKPGLTLERKNNDGPYCASNCVWATRYEQARNNRRNRLITFNGETLLLGEWAQRLGITHSALNRRLQKWPFEKAMTQLPIAWFYEI